MVTKFCDLPYGAQFLYMNELLLKIDNTRLGGAPTNSVVVATGQPRCVRIDAEVQ